MKNLLDTGRGTLLSLVLRTVPTPPERWAFSLFHAASAFFPTILRTRDTLGDIGLQALAMSKRGYAVALSYQHRKGTRIPANRSRMSASVVAYMSSPSGNCSATVSAFSSRTRHTVLGTSKL